MANYKTEAIVLTGSDYSESTRLLSLLTPELGRIRVMAKGARRAKSKTRGTVEPLTLIETRFTLKNPDGLGNLLESRVVDSLSFLRNDLDKYSCASLLVEICERTVHGGDDCLRLFILLKHFLTNLGEAEFPQEKLVRILAPFLDELGFRPVLDSCVNCNQQKPATVFAIEQGGIICRECSSNFPRALRFDPGMQKSLENLLNNPAQSKSRVSLSKKQIGNLLELLLDLAEYHLDIQLHSRAFLKP